jgi:pilus assembly protein CpaB
VTLEVTPEQAERVNVATELGKLSLTLRSVSATNVVVSSPGGFTKTAGIKPIWAGDVSPALGDAGPTKTVIVEQPIVEIIHGSKTVSVKLQ